MVSDKVLTIVTKAIELVDECTTEEAITVIFSLLKLVREVTPQDVSNFDDTVQRCVDHIVGVK